MRGKFANLHYGILVLFVLLISAMSVFATGDLTVTAAGTSTFTVANFATAETIDFTIENTAAGPKNITIESFDIIGFERTEDDIKHSDFSFNMTAPIVLENGTTITVQATVDLSGENIYKASYNGKFNVTTNNTADYDDLDAVVDVTDENKDMDLGNVNIDCVVGEAGTQNIALTNNGNVDMTNVDIESTALTSGSDIIPVTDITITPSTVNVDFQDAETIGFNVDCDASQTAGTYTGTLTASDGTYQTTATVTVNVLTEYVNLTFDESEYMETALPDESFSFTVTVKNTGTQGITNLEASFISAPSGYNLTVTPSTFDLAAGASKTLTVNGNIPEDVDTQDVEEVVLKVQDSGNTVSAQTTIKIQGKNMLNFDDVEFETDDDDQQMSDGESFEILPGDTLSISGTVLNEYSSSKDIVFEDVTVTITIKDIDDGDDLDEEIDIDDIDAGDEDDFSVEFDLPYELEDADSFDVVIEVEAEEEDTDAKHYLKWEMTLSVDRESHDIRIQDAYFTRPIVSCTRDTTLSIEIMNLGSKDEEEVTIEVSSSKFDILERIFDIEMDSDPDKSDNDYTAEFDIEIPEDTEEGTYLFTIETYYDTDEESDTETIPIEVRDCGDETTTTQRSTTTQRVTTTMAATTTLYIPPTQEPYDYVGEEPDFASSDKADTMYVALLVVGIIVGLGIIGVLIVLLSKK